jgi:peptidoglycan/LPS O-acetylase OafA/YrhL
MAPSGSIFIFVISGFVMVYSSEGLFGRSGAPIKFFARRFARIVPLYWAATAILVWFVVPYASTKAVLGSLFFAPHIPSEAPLLFVGWTLIFEMFFYTVFAIALLAKRRFAVVAGATVFLISFSVVLGPAPSAANLWSPPAASSIAYLADPVIIEFVFGMVIALIYRAGGRLDVGHNQFDHCRFRLVCGNRTLSPATIQRRHHRSINRSRNVPVVDVQPKGQPLYPWRGVFGRHLLCALLHAPPVI